MELIVGYTKEDNICVSLKDQKQSYIQQGIVMLLNPMSNLRLTVDKNTHFFMVILV